jgi:hypothetical protein
VAIFSQRCIFNPKQEEEMALVIKEWKASANGVHVRIVGREEGLISFLLSLIKIDPTTKFEVTTKGLTFERGSMSGFSKRVTPKQSISSSYYGFLKPWKTALVLFVVCFPLALALSAGVKMMGGGGYGQSSGFALFIAFIIQLAGLLVGPIYYWLNKELSVGFVEVSGWGGVVSFKRSVIEGKSIDENEAGKVCAIIEKVLEK